MHINSYLERLCWYLRLRYRNDESDDQNGRVNVHVIFGNFEPTMIQSIGIAIAHLLRMLRSTTISIPTSLMMAKCLATILFKRQLLSCLAIRSIPRNGPT